MNEKHITKILRSDSPSFVYTMKEKEALSVTVIIVSSVSFDASVQLVMEAEGGTATIRCIVLPSNGASISLETYQTHKAANAKSDLLVKTVIADISTIRFKGNVYIGANARKSDAYQKNDNLVIGDGGVIMTSPVLEILNNDVRCTHGVTTGTVPTEAIWYMGSRGISENRAKELYIEGFIRDSIHTIQGSDIEALIYNQLKGIQL